MGMDVTLAYPEGMDLDPEVITRAEENAEQNGGGFEIVHDFNEAIEGAHIVYPKAWAPKILFQPPTGQGDQEEAESIFSQYKDWKCTEEIMEIADSQAIYMHCLPADRGFEASDTVMDKTEGSGWTSAIYDQAENRLHVQKAVLNLLL
jgi:ornithine carbamoyltransferase